MKSLVFALSSLILFAFTVDKVEDYLSVKGPLTFNKTDFHLKWSDKPNDEYYIQEYLPKDESLESFNQMLTIHLFDTDIDLEGAVSQKVSELEERKKTDPVCNYQVTESPDGKEFIVDFLLGESNDDEMTIVEFNVYHYRQVDLKKKDKGIAVLAYSKRSYGDDITEFFKTLKAERNAHLNEMISSQKPSIKLKKK
ncbi:hypothetical protein [Psychroflexus aestuariivivens]|uniref:hypothetical protein n=1 Tax=Psychroflexus aestuariivivens TaxID=1795040 RepID=UPI000FDB00F3|nr:hypothetical protein [Psychroflexus aestuariivivens]